MTPRKPRFWTIMVVPNSEHEVRRFRLPSVAVRIGAITFGLILVATFLFAYSYRSMTTRMTELRELRTLAAKQEVQIDQMAKETDSIQADLRRLGELDRQVRMMIQGQSALQMPQDFDGQFTAMDPSGSDGFSQLDPEIIELPSFRNIRTLTSRFPYAFPEPQLYVPIPAESPEEDSTPVSIAGRRPMDDERTWRTRGVLPSRAGFDRGRSTTAQLQQVQEDIVVLKEEIGVRLNSLSQTAEDLDKHLAYLEARPSIWPAFGRVTSGFGWRRNPFGGPDREFHDGLDIAAPYGTPIRATGKGQVTFSGWKNAYGKVIIIDHGYGLQTLYGHNSKNVSAVGDTVEKGQIIARIGSTGRSTGPHVHYSVIFRGSMVNPRTYLP